MNNLFAAFGFGAVILLVVGLFILGPCLSIIAVNQLFGTSIQLTFWNWLSAFWLHVVVASTTSSSRS
jgi:hypothetical protein